MLRPTIYIPSRLTKSLTALSISRQEVLPRVAELLSRLQLSIERQSSSDRGVQLGEPPLDESPLRLLPGQSQRSLVGLGCLRCSA
jgi:hypothetical protein